MHLACFANRLLHNPDALFWDLEISLGESMQRTVRVCDASFESSSTARDDDTCREDACSTAASLTLDSATITQLQARLVAATSSTHVPALLSLLKQHQSIDEERRRSDRVLPLPSSSLGGNVLVECTTRRIIS